MNYLIGGLLGDFINCLAVPKLNFDTTGKKCNIFLSCIENEQFKTGIDQTYNDLKPILLAQPYINKFSKYKNENIDIDMLHFRTPLKKYRKSCCYWLEFLFNFYNKKSIINKEFKWLFHRKKDTSLQDTVLLHRPFYRKLTKKSKKTYNNIICNNNTQFLFNNEQDYESFPLRKLVTPLYVPTLLDIVTKINSCKMFVGNQSAYYCIANSLNKNRGIEVNRPTCWRMYERESIYYKKVFKFG
tara:strand:- start:90 stop:815 length:726 start_codon:yes stop_codon:yes gene_type:complete